MDMNYITVQRQVEGIGRSIMIMQKGFHPESLKSQVQSPTLPKPEISSDLVKNKTQTNKQTDKKQRQAGFCETVGINIVVKIIICILI